MERGKTPFHRSNILLYHKKMSQRKSQFINGEVYHIVTRTTEGIKLFQDQKDYLRMVRDLFEFNDSDVVVSTFRTRYHRKNVNGTGKDPVP